MVERQFLATGADLSRKIYDEDEIYDEDALFTDPLSTPSRCQSPSRAPKLFFKEKSDVRLVGAVTVCALHVPCPYCIDAPCMYPHVHVVMCHVCAMRVHMQADAQQVEFRFDEDLCFNIPFHSRW